MTGMRLGRRAPRLLAAVSFAAILSLPALVLPADEVQAAGFGQLPADGSEVTVCPVSPVSGGADVNASFAGHSKAHRTVAYGRRVLLRGRVIDAGGNGIPGALVCVEERLGLPGFGYRLDGTATTSEDGDWSFALRSGASRSIRVVYRSASGQVDANLDLAVRAHAKLHLSRHQTPSHRRVHFYGRIPGPFPGGRIVFIRATVPGARRKYLVRYARTDPFGRFRAAYAFAPVTVRIKFVFWAVVPAQNGYPYLLGRSAGHFIRVSP
jgi:hypothetical protein